MLPSILNVRAAAFRSARAGQPSPSASTDRERAINELAADLPRYWSYGPFDAPIVYAALEHLRTTQPRVLYVMLGEGDEWAHDGRYDLYLDATYRADRFIRRFWDTVPVDARRTGQDRADLTTDHGRGATVKDWTDHGRDVPAAERTWMALIGPGVPPLGVRRRRPGHDVADRRDDRGLGR